MLILEDNFLKPLPSLAVIVLYMDIIQDLKVQEPLPNRHVPRVYIYIYIYIYMLSQDPIIQKRPIIC